MGDIIKLWERYLTALYAKTTVRAYLYDIRRFEQWLLSTEGRVLLLAKTADVQRFITQASEFWTAGTILRFISALRSFYTWAIQESLLDASPVNAIKTPRGGKRLPRVLRPDEVQALLQHREDRRERAILLLMLDAGLRLVEVSRLRRTDVNLQDRTILVQGKGDKQRMVPLSERLYDALAAWLYHHPGLPVDPLFPGYRNGALKPRAIGYIVSAIGQQAGLQRSLSPHLLRHTFATRLLRQGVNLRVIQQLLGHASVATTQIYTEVVAEDLQAAIGRLK